MFTPTSGGTVMRIRCGMLSRVATLFAVAAIGIISFVPLVQGTAAAASSSTLQGKGSVDEAWLAGANPGDRITLMQHNSSVSNVANPGTADSLGSLIIRNLTPGPGYRWVDNTTTQQTSTFSVLAPGVNPATDSTLYTGQPLHQGLNYITMRDGIQLAATVRYPYGGTCSTASPCPTVIEYSGYNVAGPTDPIPGILAQALHTPCANCGDPNLLPDTATAVGSVLARVSGFATVSLQMRGTGCSAGAFDLFGYPSDYDAYDAVEIVAHQSWAAHHKVGMVGISFSGLSEFPSAGTDPPDLAAIAPMSPTDDLFSTGYPGGIYNDGFAASWIAARIDDAQGAASYRNGQLIQRSPTPIANVGQPWTYYEIDAELASSGGTSSPCLANQALHNQSESLASLVGPQLVAPGTGPGRQPSLFDQRSMREWASHVKVPIFVSGALQDEQTGPQWPALIDAVPKSTPLYSNMVNGGHIDSTDPQTISRWLEFLDIYVANEVPTAPSALASAVLDGFTGFASGVSAQAPLPAIRFTGDTNVAAARADFAAQTPLVRVLFDNGAGSAGPGDIQSTYSADFSSWPPAGTVESLYLGRKGTLKPTAPTQQKSATFTLDPSARPATSLPASGNAWAANPGWDWTTVPATDGIAFETTPFTTATTIVGPATLDLWIKSDTSVEDFQATITEVRPSAAQEEYVTSGFLRSSNQVDLSDSTPLFTDPSYLGSDARNLSASDYTLVKIPIDPVVHTFRPGTELRVVISAPGGDRPIWEFATLDHGQSAKVGVGGVTASALVVNVVPGVAATPILPACGSLRGEPCRAYQAESNQPGSLTSMLTPSDGATLSGGQLLDAGAAPATTAEVDFTASGGPDKHMVISGSTLTYYGWIGTWDTATVPNGVYTLRSVAHETNGGIGHSAPITVTVANSPLATSVLVPSTGATLHAGSVLDAGTTGTPPATGVTFELSGGALTDTVVGTATPTIYGWISSMDTADVPPGTYTLQSVATDATGTATSPGITVTVAGNAVVPP
jgi:predicted acyl esterase